MNFIAMVCVVVVATFVTTWFNDNISKAEYIHDEAP
jgi:hypothetical protein